MRYYISGRITGLPKEEYMAHFNVAQQKLEREGNSVINPAAVMEKMPCDTSYEEYMKMSMLLIDMCDAIYMLDGWEKSCGANREYGYAMAKDVIILFESD